MAQWVRVASGGRVSGRVPGRCAFWAQVESGSQSRERLRQLFVRPRRREAAREQPLVKTVAKMAVWDEAQSSYAETATSLQHCDPARRYRKAGPVYQRTALKSGR